MIDDGSHDASCAICASRGQGMHIAPDWFVGIPGGDAPLLGWLTLATVAHRDSVARLLPNEAMSLGQLLRQLSEGIEAVTGAERTYVANWAEATRHVHFHVIPRSASHDPERLGFEVFRLMSDDIPHPPIAEQQSVLREVFEYVSSRGIA